MLYTGDPVDRAQVEAYLSGVELPRLSKADREYLEAEITAQEVQLTILRLPVGKPPGSDGFPPECYKKYAGRLAPILAELFNNILKGEVLSE